MFRNAGRAVVVVSVSTYVTKTIYKSRYSPVSSAAVVTSTKTRYGRMGRMSARLPCTVAMTTISYVACIVTNVLRGTIVYLIVKVTLRVKILLTVGTVAGSRASEIGAAGWGPREGQKISPHFLFARV